MKSTEIKQIYKKRFLEDVVMRKTMWKILVNSFFQKYIPKTSTILEIATGYGEFINNVKARKRFACDINPDSKKFLSKDIMFLKASSTKIPLRDMFVDVIFISNFFEHITRENIIKTVQECKRLLKKNGKVLILQPNIRFCQKDYWMFFDHITPIDDRALNEIFTSFSFRLTTKIEKFLPYSTKSNLPKNSFFVKLYLRLSLLWYFFGKQSFLIFEK